MLKLRSAPPSPFGRKVKIAARMLGLADRIEIVVADTNDASDSLRRENPLGKIPCLVLADGLGVYDSRVIAEVLDQMAGGGKLIPADASARIRTLTLQALADGIMDAAILIVYETRWREEAMRSPRWVAHQQSKIDRALSVLEANPPHGAIDIGHIAAACALGYLDLRFGGAWRADHPNMVAWLNAFAAAVPAFEATRFVQPA